MKKILEKIRNWIREYHSLPKCSQYQYEINKYDLGLVPRYTVGHHSIERDTLLIMHRFMINLENESKLHHVCYLWVPSPLTHIMYLGYWFEYHVIRYIMMILWDLGIINLPSYLKFQYRDILKCLPGGELWNQAQKNDKSLSEKYRGYALPHARRKRTIRRWLHISKELSGKNA